MPFKLFEILKQFKIRTFLILLTQVEKTGSISKTFILLETLKLNSTFETRNRSRFSKIVIGEHYLCNFQQINFNWTQKLYINLNSFINALINLNEHL